MIGRPEWFERRKYGGWGLHPKNWKGWAYITIIIIPFVIFHSLPYWSFTTRVIVTILWGVFLVIDTIDIMARMKKDEREKIHEAIAERNAVWGMSVILAIGIAYQIAASAIKQTINVDWWLVAALFIGLIIKSISNYYLDRKN